MCSVNPRGPAKWRLYAIIFTFFNLDVIQHEIEDQATISFFNFYSTAALWLSIIFADIYDQGVKKSSCNVIANSAH